MQISMLSSIGSSFVSGTISRVIATCLLLATTAAAQQLGDNRYPSSAQQPTAQGSQLQTFSVKHRDAAELAERVRTLLGPAGGGGVFVSPDTNEIVIRGTAADRAIAAQVITKLDQSVAQSVGQPASLKSYRIPAEHQATVAEWASKFAQTRPAGSTERAAWDSRTGQLILFGSAEDHAEVAQLIGTPTLGAAVPASPTNQAPLSDASSDSSPKSTLTVRSPAREGLRLRTLTPEALHRRLESLASRPLPATWNTGRTALTFPVQMGSMPAVTLRVDSNEQSVQFQGERGQVEAWRQVIAAMDKPAADPLQSTRVVNASQAQKPAITRALTALGGKQEPKRGTPGKLVTMLMQQPEGGQQAAPAAGQPAGGQPMMGPDGQITGGSLLGPVQVEFVEGLDIIVLRGNEQDVARVMQIIEQIEDLSAVTVPEIIVHPLKNVASEPMARLMDRVYSQVLGPRTGSVSITPLGKPNSLLLIGREENVRMAISLAQQLDQPVEPSTRFQVFPLKHASAGDAKTLIDDFLDRDDDDEDSTTLSPEALVVADFRTNSVIVSAAPRELVEIKSLLDRIDTAGAQAVDEVRVFPLRNSLAGDLADVIREAISQGGDDDDEGGRASGLRFITIDAETQRRLESGVLTNVRIAADERANALIVTAAADSMDLLEALIRQLDQSPDAEAQLKVFTIANGDAVALQEMLSSLFRTDEEDDENGGIGAGANSLVKLQLSVDQRTNSIVAAGSTEDLAVVEAILLRLDGSDTRGRESRIYRLNNAYAVAVAESLNTAIEAEREAEDAAELVSSPFEQIEREVIVVAEEASNSLIISASPERFQQISKLIEELDEQPPMVMVQVLIAEVRLNDTDEFGMELGLQDSLLFDRSLVGEFSTITTTTQDQSPGGAILTTTVDNIINSPLTPGFNFNNVNQPLGNNGSTQALANAGNVATQGLANFGVGRVNNSLGFGGFVLSASSNAVDMLLRALQENRRLEILSRPQIMALDGQTGSIVVGQSVPLIQSVSIGQFGNQQNNIDYEDVGIILEVTPRISPEGLVVMQVQATKSEVGPEAEGVPISISESGAVLRAPVIDKTDAFTTVSANSGQTVVLSGLLTKSTSDIHRRVPILADIPLLGDLFRFDSVSQERTELLIILTPRVIRSEVDAEMIKQVESSRMSWVMCDVVNMHGPSGLRNRCDEWGPGEGEAVYPTHIPSDCELGGCETGDCGPATGQPVDGPVYENAQPIESAPMPANPMPTSPTQMTPQDWNLGKSTDKGTVEPVSYRSQTPAQATPASSPQRLPPVEK